MAGLSRSEQRQIEAAIKASGDNEGKDKGDSDSDEDTPMSKKVVVPKKVSPTAAPASSPLLLLDARARQLRSSPRLQSQFPFPTPC